MRPVARETDAALNALNILVDAVDQAVVDTLDGYPRLYAAIALAQSSGTPLNVENYLDAMVAENLEDLRAIVTGEESRAAKEDIDALVAAWEEMLSSEGDDAQLAMIDLHNMLQKMQQTIQMLLLTDEKISQNKVSKLAKVNRRTVAKYWDEFAV